MIERESTEHGMFIPYRNLFWVMKSLISSATIRLIGFAFITFIDIHPVDYLVIVVTIQISRMWIIFFVRCVNIHYIVYLIVYNTCMLGRFYNFKKT